MKRLTRKLTKLSSRLEKYQSGQSLFLLAIALVVLIGFTGLVTDVSILFVRYSNLRRTVDSAAIAAAGQIREGTDYESVALAARQFIQLHGLEPHRVLVETCETDIANWRAGTGAWEGQGMHPEATYPNPSDMGETELCNWEAPRKLVRVTAQIESETYFLQLLGLDTITLETSSVSETAVLDVALVLDTSESMAAATDFADYTNAADYLQRRGANMNYIVSGAPEPSNGIREDCAQAIPHDGDPATQRKYLSFAPCCNDPGRGQVYLDNGGNWIIYSETGGGQGYQAGLDTLGVIDNTADLDYSDLVCNPFRQVKDAARNFVLRLDFVRGDRVTFVVFDRIGRNIVPDGESDPANIMITDEDQALSTLNKYVGVKTSVVNNNIHPPDYSRFEFRGDCPPFTAAAGDYYNNPTDPPDNSTGENPDFLRYMHYESLAPCPDTNIGGGIEAGNNALTNAATIRRDAVWVMIVLSDGAATATSPIGDFDPDDFSYGYAGYCPWSTFCNPTNSGHSAYNGSLPSYSPECDAGTLLYPTKGANPPFCNDDNPNTRHFCLQWSTDPDLNGKPDLTNPECGPAGGYDADDYARDWADFAGLVNVADGVPGNFIAIFTIGFGSEIASTNTGAPLLRYIADAGDNGFIDNDLQQDFRDDHVQNNSVPADEIGEPGECEGAVSNTEWCGQYYYANNLSELDAVFEAIASRLFTRLSR